MGVRIRNPRGMVVTETAESRAYAEALTKALYANLALGREQTRGSMTQLGLLLGQHLRETAVQAEAAGRPAEVPQPPADAA